MTGLEKILAAIESEADEKASEILQNADNETKNYLDEAASSTEAECAQIIESGKAKASVIERIAASGAELEGKKLLLTARREIIGDVIDRALEALRALPDDQYFDVLSRLAVYYAEKGEGEMLLSEKDKARLPQGFMESVNRKLSEKNAVLKVAHDTRETGGGFVLCYGGIEINCTFDALVDGRREQLGDKLGRYIFG